jgi:hypothetical protein
LTKEKRGALHFINEPYKIANNFSELNNEATRF